VLAVQLILNLKKLIDEDADNIGEKWEKISEVLIFYSSTATYSKSNWNGKWNGFLTKIQSIFKRTKKISEEALDILALSPMR